MVRKDAIREKILGLGADVCGFGGMERFTEAPINFRPIDLYPDCKSVTQKKCRQNTYGNTARGFDTVDCNKCRRECPMRDGLL